MEKKYNYVKAGSSDEIEIYAREGYRVHSVHFSEGGNIVSALMEKEL